MTSCAQSEADYQQTEARMLKDWKPERAEQEQNRDWRIPGWLNAPDWANWLQFCSKRGWMFVDQQPHLYGAGVMSLQTETGTIKSVRACEVPGVLFFENRNKTSGGAAPFWVMDRRAGRTVGANAATAQPAPPGVTGQVKRPNKGP